MPLSDHFWDRWPSLVGKSINYVLRHDHQSGQLSLASLWGVKIEHQVRSAEVKAGKSPMWSQYGTRSGVVKCYPLYLLHLHTYYIQKCYLLAKIWHLKWTFSAVSYRISEHCKILPRTWQYILTTLYMTTASKSFTQQKFTNARRFVDFGRMRIRDTVIHW